MAIPSNDPNSLFTIEPGSPDTELIRRIIELRKGDIYMLIQQIFTSEQDELKRKELVFTKLYNLERITDNKIVIWKSNQTILYNSLITNFLNEIDKLCNELILFINSEVNAIEPKLTLNSEII